MKANRHEKTIEDFAIRVMYFFNTMDSFLLFSVAAYFVCSLALIGKIHFLVQFYNHPGLVLIFLVFFYAILRTGDFYPYFLFFMPFYFYLLVTMDPNWPIHLFKIFTSMFIFTSVIQILLMGFPMSLAARKPDIPLRIYLNSFLNLSPTTISLPLTVTYTSFLIYASKVVSENLTENNSAVFLTAFLLSSFLISKTKKKNIMLHPYHPLNSFKPFKRVILLNIDGLGYAAFKRSQASFLKEMEKKFCGVQGGARTVYRALTNPAFVSMLTGTYPEKHGVKNNNVGQRIRVEAIPDFTETRLYGSMHVRHFSRKDWNVKVFSLVELGFDKTDPIMMEQLKQDIEQDTRTRFWIADLSHVDYAGHAWGSYSKQYYDAILKTDSLIEDFIKWMQEKHLLEETMIVISSDHGLFIGEHSFLLFKAEEFVPLIFIGKGIFPLKFSFPISIADICSNVSFSLGQRYCSNDSGRAFEDMFNNAESNDDFQKRLISGFGRF